MTRSVRLSPLLLTLSIATCFLLASTLGQPVIVAQTAPPTHPGQGASSVGVPKSPHPHQEPCWQVAGIPKSAMEQRRAITRATTSQVESVCADSSLTQQQKRDKIRQIHEQARQQEQALASPQQMESLRECQAQRNGGHPSVGVHHGGNGSGPCGELPKNSVPGNHPAGNQEQSEPQNEN